jgi:hypothetical protein
MRSLDSVRMNKTCLCNQHDFGHKSMFLNRKRSLLLQVLAQRGQKAPIRSKQEESMEVFESLEMVQGPNSLGQRGLFSLKMT